MKEMKVQVTVYFLHLRSSHATSGTVWVAELAFLATALERAITESASGGTFVVPCEAKVADETILGRYHGRSDHRWWVVSVSRLSTCILSCQQITSLSVALK